MFVAGDASAGKTTLVRQLSDGDVTKDHARKSVCNFGSFTTERRQFTFIDPPSSRQCFAQFYGGACIADVAVLVIAAGDESIACSFKKTPSSPFAYKNANVGLDHLLSFYTLSTTRLIVVVSKLDFFPLNEQEQRFIEVCYWQILFIRAFFF
jgi:translation elongation factor EF-1alpha